MGAKAKIQQKLTNLFRLATIFPMQSNKASKKTRKAADAVAANPELNAAEGTAKARASRSSQSKMQETNETASSSHRHKIVSPVPEGVVEPTSAQTEVRDADSKVMAAAAGTATAPVSGIVDSVGQMTAGETNRAANSSVRDAAPTREVNSAEVADLAYSYFVARGYQHGHDDEDWLRAERELRSVRSA
jgi:hypothetical protein